MITHTLGCSPVHRGRRFFSPVLCIFVLLIFTLAGCSSNDREPTPVVVAPTNENPGEGNPVDQNPDPIDPAGSSQFTGKLSFSSALGWPLNIFDFDTNTYDLSLETDPMKEWLGDVDLDPSATYAAYVRTFLDGLFTGKTSQVVLRDLSSDQEFALPFSNGDPTQLLNSRGPSVSATGLVVFERYTDTLNSEGLPVDRIGEGLSYWNGAGQAVALAAAVPSPSRPKITEDGTTVFFLAESNGEEAIWKTSLAADNPVPVVVPASGESLALNSGNIFEVSNDGSTIVYRVRRGDVSVIRYTTPLRSGVVEFPEPKTSIYAQGLSGDGSTLVVGTLTTTDDPSAESALIWRLYVINLNDGNSQLAEDSSQVGNDFSLLLPWLAVSDKGDAVALVSTDPDPETLYSLFAFKPGEFNNAQRIIRDSEYAGITSVTLSVQFRGGLR